MLKRFGTLEFIKCWPCNLLFCVIFHQHQTMSLDSEREGERKTELVPGRHNKAGRVNAHCV